MNLRKKALVPAIAMALVSVIALTGVTYAWFTTGNSATVSELNVNVQTANGIQVSLDAASWRSSISAADIQAAIGASSQIQLPNGEIAPVSTAGTISDGKLQMFLGEYNKNGTLKSTVADEQNQLGGNFVAFDLYFKSSTEQTLTLKRGTAQSYVKGIDMSKNNAATNVGTENAVRVAFINVGSAQTAAEARSLKAASDATVQIWEPNSGTRAPSVEADTGKLPYKGFKTTFDNVAETALGDDQVASVTTVDADIDVVQLKVGINKVRVYIWLEGQDVDCVNAISFGDFAANLFFAVPEV